MNIIYCNYIVFFDFVLHYRGRPPAVLRAPGLAGLGLGAAAGRRGPEALGSFLLLMNLGGPLKGVLRAPLNGLGVDIRQV